MCDLEFRYQHIGCPQLLTLGDGFGTEPVRWVKHTAIHQQRYKRAKRWPDPTCVGQNARSGGHMEPLMKEVTMQALR